ncbi:MAG: nitrite reductase small subunit NirD [Polyangiaceae bacterium]
MQALIEITRPEAQLEEWRDVCAIDDVLPGSGVAALVDGEQIAIIRTRGGQFSALSNFDPFSKAFVIARGIVGDRGGVPKIASPIYKQNFSLETGQCLDDPSVRLQVFPIRVLGGRVQVSVSAKVAE